MLSKGLMISTGLLAVLAWFLWTQNGNLREEIGKAEAAVVQAKQTNDNNLTSITELGDRLDTCVREREVDVAAGVAVVSKLKADILDLEGRSLEVRIEREEIFREPSCEELGELDITAICPALSTSLRERADSLN
jgi:hypothetical protein